MKKHSVVGLVLAGMLIALTAVALTYHFTRADLNSIFLPGTQIETSDFVDCVSEVLDEAVYPAEDPIITYRPLILEFDFTGYELLGEQEATQLALAFLQKELSDIGVLEVVHSEIWGPNPRWILVFNGSMDIGVQLNAISGKIISYWVDSFNTGNLSITNEQATEVVLTFLETHDYTLPKNARFLGIETISDSEDRIETYVFRFLHFEGSVFIGDNPSNQLWGGNIVFCVDAKTAMVTRFSYFWLQVPELSVSGLVNPEIAKASVSEFLGGGPPIQVSNITLALCTIPTTEFPASGFIMLKQLFWIISTPQPWAEWYCDAFTGEYLGFSVIYWGEYPSTYQYLPMAFRVILIVIASGIAGVVAYILSSRVLRRVEHNRFIRR